MSGDISEHAPDAIEILKADHRQVQGWFEEFQSCQSAHREQELALLICEAIRRHAKIDARLFYPAFLAATGDEYKCKVMLREEQDINELIDEIEVSGPSEDSFFAKLHLLCIMFERHVEREEKERGIFKEAVKAGLDLGHLGRELEDSAALPELNRAPYARGHAQS
jgi:hypothetical protein